MTEGCDWSSSDTSSSAVYLCACVYDPSIRWDLTAISKDKHMFLRSCCWWYYFLLLLLILFIIIMKWCSSSLSLFSSWLIKVASKQSTDFSGGFHLDRIGSNGGHRSFRSTPGSLKHECGKFSFLAMPSNSSSEADQCWIIMHATRIKRSVWSLVIDSLLSQLIAGKQAYNFTGWKPLWFVWIRWSRAGMLMCRRIFTLPCKNTDFCSINQCHAHWFGWRPSNELTQW